MAVYAGFTLLVPGTFLDALWGLNKPGHDGLAALGRLAALPFVILCPMLGLAALGWFRRRRWGWVLGITIIAINMTGDLGQLFLGKRWKGAIGLVVAGLLLSYMARRRVRDYFGEEVRSRPS
jgi:hypothetical protein